MFQLFTSLRLNLTQWLSFLGYPAGAAVSVGCCYCKPEMALQLKSSGTDPVATTARPQQPRRTRVGRQICLSVASGVCFSRPCLLMCMLSLFLGGGGEEGVHTSGHKANCKGDGRPARGAITERFSCGLLIALTCVYSKRGKTHDDTKQDLSYECLWL